MIPLCLIEGEAGWWIRAGKYDVPGPDQLFSTMPYYSAGFTSVSASEISNLLNPKKSAATMT